MRRARFDERSENGGAALAIEDTSALMCRAHGCPMRWSFALTGESRGLCSAHQQADKAEEWPAITDRVRNGWWPYRKQTREESAEMMAARNAASDEVSALRGGGPHLSGAWMLRKAELEHGNRLPDGRALTASQRSYWRAALRQVLLEMGKEQ